MISIQLMDLPHELLHKVLSDCEPTDIPSLSATCRGLRQFIANNRQLFKEIYLNRLDLPQKEPDWEKEVKKFLALKRILDSDNVETKEANLPFIAQTISSYLSNSSPNQDSSKTISLLSEISSNPQNRECLFSNSTLFQRVRFNSNCTAGWERWESPDYNLTEEQRQASAKLHALYGKPIYTTFQSPVSRPLTRSTRTYPCAVSKVYDLRNYTDGSFWGPFKDDGQATVDWEKIEAIMVVLGHNMRDFAEKIGGSMKMLCNRIWTEPWKDAVRNSCNAVHVPRVEEPGLSLDARDPYGITGTYMRVVCFLDYTELFTYNFVAPAPPRNDIPRPPLDTVEATRMIVMDLKVTKIEAPGEDDGQDYPVVHFRGTSRSVDSSWDPNANSNIRGTVRQTREGEIRWTTYSIYHGEERWKSESIQIGGIRSARGTIGNWFDKDYDIHGPAGPTAFWKVSEEVLEEMMEMDEEENEDGDDVDDGEWNVGDEDQEDGMDEGEEEDGGEEDGNGAEWVGVGGGSVVGDAIDTGGNLLFSLEHAGPGRGILSFFLAEHGSGQGQENSHGQGSGQGNKRGQLSSSASAAATSTDDDDDEDHNVGMWSTLDFAHPAGYDSEGKNPPDADADKGPK